MRHGFGREPEMLYWTVLPSLRWTCSPDVAHALALVRLRRIEAAEFGGHLADDLLVRAFDGQLGVLLDRHFDLVGNRVIDRDAR